MNFRPSHIPFDRLIDWVEARLTTEERNQLQSHLTDCAHCRQELAQVERLFGLMQHDTSVDPPPAVINRALRIFQPRLSPTTSPPLLKRIVAALQFDSLQRSPALGLRSGTAPRQLLFTAGDYDLDLRLTPTDKAELWVVAGQVLGDDTITGNVALQGATANYQAPLVAPGEFLLPTVAAGEYTLVVHLPNQEIAIESFTVGG